MTHTKVLVRLMDVTNEAVIRAFYTTTPKEILEMYYFCKENDIGINVPINDDNPNDKYNNEACLGIEDIEVNFGSDTHFNTIDIWVKI